MSNKYRYDHRSSKHKKRHAFIVLIISLLVIAILAITILYLINQNTKKIKNVSGPNVLVGQVTDNSSGSTSVINEPFYSFKLPITWHQTKTVSNAIQNSVTWQSFAKDATNRFLTIYLNPIPATYPVNRELPIEAHGSTLSFGSISDNCADFSNAGTTKPLTPVLAKWQNVNFYCNSPNFVDNQVGTGTNGAINSVTLTGNSGGTHSYFFLYIDRNSSPDYSILYTILNSFQAK